MRGVLADPSTQTLVDCSIPELEFVREVQLGGLRVLLSGEQVDKYFVLEGYPKVLSGVAFFPETTSEELAKIIDFGTTVEAGEITLFIGNINIREFRS